MPPDAPIVLIGGANGAGKTFLAGRLAAALAIDHRLGTGFVREVLRSEAQGDSDPALSGHSFAPPNPVETLRTQAERLRPAVLRCIERAGAEGTSLIIDGTHLLPELYSEVPGVDHRFLLRVPRDPREHQNRLNGAGHLNRARFGEHELTRVQRVDRYLAATAEAHNFTVLSEHSVADVLRYCRESPTVLRVQPVAALAGRRLR